MRIILADGAFGHIQPLVDTPRQIRRIYAMEYQINRAVKAGPLPPNTKVPKDLLDQIRTWSLIAQKKRIFLCQVRDEQFMDLGLVPRAIQICGLVCLLKSSRVPCLLRKNDRTYKIVGQCYLVKWMKEDVPQGRKWMPEQDQKLFLV
jgi:hypothetical protein